MTTEPFDLSRFGVMQSFARVTTSERLLGFLARLDDVDSWAVDFREEESPNLFEIQALMAEVQGFLGANFDALHVAPKQFLELLGGMRSSRCLYVLRLTMEQNPQLGSEIERLLDDPEQSRLTAVVKRRIEAFTKAKLLGEIFSGQRLERIRAIMGAQNVRSGT